MVSYFGGWNPRNGAQNGRPSSTSTSPEYSSRYNSQDAEVIYESSDHVRFRIHKIYLETHTGGLSPPTEMGLEEIVHLPETSEALEVLFDFIYPIAKAKVFARISCRSKLLAEAAEAAEKYQIFPAMNACFHVMRDTLPAAALPILAHALRHSYVSLANEAAPHLLDEAPANVTAAIPPEYFPTWLKYHQGWVDLQREILTNDVPLHKPDWDIVSQISGSLCYLKQVAVALGDSDQHNEWGKQIQRRIERLPKLMDHTTRRTDTYGPFTSDFTSSSDPDLVTLYSAENWKFSIRRDVLLKCAPGFSDILPPGKREVHLVEDERTVKILVGFLRPATSPYINWPHATINYLLNLAYVLEKYKVYYGMYLFKYFIQKRVNDHPSHVFVYAAKCGYHDILDEAAPLVATSQDKFTPVMHLLPMQMRSAWASYNQRWIEACFEAVKLITKEFSGHEGCSCGGCKKRRKAGDKSFFETFAGPAIKLLMEGPHSLALLDSTLRLVDVPTSWPKCSTRESAIDAVNHGVQEYRDSIDEFSSFIEGSLALDDVASLEDLDSDPSMD